jgi:hypothetical protein
MRRPLAALLAAGLAAAPETAMSAPAEPAAAVRAAVSFKAPAGWEESAHTNGRDPVLHLRSGLYRISLSVFGGEGSAYATPELFLSGPAGTTMGVPAKPKGEAVVAGKKRPVYERGHILGASSPIPAPGGRPPLAQERFVILPLAGGRFAVAAYAFEDPIPSAKPDGSLAFDAFLKTLRPAPAKKKRR